MNEIRLSFVTGKGEAAARLLPTAFFVALAVALAWRERGSIAAPDWLAYLVAAAVLVAAVALSGGARELSPLVRLAASALGLLALWALITALWSPAPALARDEALLRALYLAALVVPAWTLRDAVDRTRAAALVVAAAGGVAVATAVRLLVLDDASALYQEGRPYFPITYPNAAAAFFAVAFWPAVALASRTHGSPVGRALAVAAATSCTAAAVSYQSKGALAAFALSAIVFFAISPRRVRTFVPTAIALALTGAAFVPLTEPIRAAEAGLGEAVRGSALALLVATAVGLGAGLAYALVDRRMALSARTVRIASAGLGIALAVAVAGGAAAFVSSVGDPAGYLSARWDDLQAPPEDDGFTHFGTLGSNRVDFWRVSLRDFEENPIAGVGSRGFATSYLERGRSVETPARAHSLPLDVLGEEGNVGAALLLLALAPLVAIALAAGRRSLGATAIAAAAVYWLAHASVDWNWSFPALGIPFFVLLGIAASGGRRRLGPAAAGWIAAAAVIVAIAASAQWVSARMTERAAEGGPTVARDLRWARRLDPLSTRPLVVEWQLAQTPDARIDALERALQREPESFPLRYFLGLALRDAGRTDEARIELREAKRRAPRVEAVDEALSTVGG